MNHDYLRSFLFVPATRPDRITKAKESGADAVIVDLEDAVAPDLKASARSALAEYLDSHPNTTVLVRINSVDSEHFDDDVALCKAQANIQGIMLPKADDADALARLINEVQKPIWPLIETASGSTALPELVKVAGVARLSIGALDMATDLGLVSDTDGAAQMLDFCRSQLVVYSRAAGLAPPIETVVPSIDNRELISKVATKACEMGFGGMLAIHPKQLGPIHEAFTPSAEKVSWAQRVVEAAAVQGAVFQLDGKMVDAPVVSEAQRVLARAGLL